MRPIVAMWCAICSQKSFLFTSQNISEGIACAGNSTSISRHAAARFCAHCLLSPKRLGIQDLVVV